MQHEFSNEIPDNCRIYSGWATSATQMEPTGARPLFPGLQPDSVLGDLEWWEKEKLGIKNPRTSAYQTVLSTYGSYLAEAAGGVKISFEQAELVRSPGAKLDPYAWDHYFNQFKFLRENGLLSNSIIGTHHFESPLWATQEGGWLNRRMADYYVDFVIQMCEKMYACIPDGQVVNLMLVNEFMNEMLGRADEAFPPQNPKYISKRHSPIDPLLIIYEELTHSMGNVQYAIQRISEHLHAHHWDDKVHTGIGIHPVPLVAQHPDDKREQRWVKINNWILNEAPMWLLDRSRKYIDFIGIQPYRYEVVKYIPQLIPKAGKEYFEQQGYTGRQGLHVESIPSDETDNGWRIDMGFLPQLLLNIARRYKGIELKITEAGVAGSSKAQVYGLVALYEALSQYNSIAVSEGLSPIHSFLKWTLTYTKEWNVKQVPRFGALRIDNTERKIMAFMKVLMRRGVLRRSDVEASLRSIFIHEPSEVESLTRRIFQAPQVVIRTG